MKKILLEIVLNSFLGWSFFLQSYVYYLNFFKSNLMNWLEWSRESNTDTYFAWECSHHTCETNPFCSTFYENYVIVCNKKKMLTYVKTTSLLNEAALKFLILSYDLMPEASAWGLRQLEAYFGCSSNWIFQRRTSF